MKLIIDGKVELTRMSKERLAGRRTVEFAGGVAIKTVSLTGVLSCLLLLIEAFFMTSDATVGSVSHGHISVSSLVALF